MRTWVDASTVIALDAIGEVPLLRDLLGRVTLTSEVAAEVFQGRESEALNQARGTWIEVVPVSGNRSRWESLGLGRGETYLFFHLGTARLRLPRRTPAGVEGDGRWCIPCLLRALCG